MIESEWFESRDPSEMLRSWLGYHACERTRWLFALACIDPIAPLLPNADYARAHEITWRAVEGELDPTELAILWPLPDYPGSPTRWIRDEVCNPDHARSVAQEAALFAIWEYGRHLPGAPGAFSAHRYDPQPPVTAAEEAALALTAVGFARGGPEFVASRSRVQTMAAFEEAYTRTRARQARWVRDIFGNPFRPVAFDATWRTSDVILLARGIYAERAFDRMPILADALQDAGCYDDDVLFHCRAGTDHVRGCWVLDSILKKS